MVAGFCEGSWWGPGLRPWLSDGMTAKPSEPASSSGSLYLEICAIIRRGELHSELLDIDRGSGQLLVAP